MEFSLPTRIRWAVDFRGRAARSKRIARHIREIAPRIVELRIEGEKGLSEFSAIFSEIHKGNPRIEATIRVSPKAASALRWGYPIELIWEIEGEQSVFAGALPEGSRTISFTPDRKNIGLLPDILKDFSESTAEELRLPHVDAVRAIAEEGHVPIPTPAQLRKASERITRAGVSLLGKRLIVHDYFLWRRLREAFPKEAGESVDFPGCQAGSDLAYIDWDGNVYPCDSLPVRLGSLSEMSLERIWRLPARRQVAEAIRRAPGDCESCHVYSGCFGGCRGLAYLASASFGARDPACPDDF